jgi:hypothetical protein
MRDEAAAARLARQFDATDWRRIMFFAGEDLLTPELAAPLRLPALVHFVPREVVEHAAELESLNAERNRRIAAQFREMLPAFTTASVRPLLLKGARSFVDTEPSRENRVLRDLDLLFPAEQLGRAVSVIESLGYQRQDADPGGHAVAYFHRPSDPAAIDLHRELLIVSHLLPVSAVLQGARGATVFGHNVQVATETDEVLHGVLHEAVHHYAFSNAAISIRALFDIANRLPALTEVDWRSLTARAAGTRCLPLLSTALRLCECVFGPAVLDTCEGDLTRSVSARLSAGRVWAKGSGLMPCGLEKMLSASARWLAPHQHRPGIDGAFIVWKANRYVSGSRRAIAKLAPR